MQRTEDFNRGGLIAKPQCSESGEKKLKCQFKKKNQLVPESTLVLCGFGEVSYTLI